MTLVHYLFSFSGRINRAKQWAIILVGLAFEVLAVVAIATIVGFGAIGEVFEKKTTFATLAATGQAQMLAVVLCLLYVLLLYVGAAVTVKRLHDRNRSAWWLLVFYVLPAVLSVPALMQAIDMLHHMDAIMKATQAGQPPYVETPLAIIGRGASSIISLWAFVELYCLRGTEGDNRYGPDPLGGHG